MSLWGGPARSSPLYQIDGSDDREKHQVNKVKGVYFGWWAFGSFAKSNLQNIGVSLRRATNRCTYTVNVLNMYHSLDREGVQALKEEARREGAQAWDEAI